MRPCPALIIAVILLVALPACPTPAQPFQIGQESSCPIIAIGIGTQILFYQYAPDIDDYDLLWETVPSGRLTYQNSDVYWQPCFGDADNDGEIELVSVDESRLCVWGDRGNAPIHVELSDESFPIGLAVVADADGDGRQEILVGFATHLTVWRYTEENLHQIASYDLPPNRGEMIWNINVADLNSDGVTDILVGGALSRGGRGVLYLFRLHDGALQMQGGIPILMDADVTKICDWDGDGRCEIFTSGNAQRIQAFRWNPAPGVFEQFWCSEDLNGFMQGLALGDLDRDGRPELVAGSYSSSEYHITPPTLYVFSHSEQGTPTLRSRKTTIQVGYPGIVIYDLDSDGLPEILVNGMKVYEVDPDSGGEFALQLAHEIQGLGERPGEIQPNAAVTRSFTIAGRRHLDPDIRIQQLSVIRGGRNSTISLSTREVHLAIAMQNVGSEASKILMRLICNDPRIEVIQGEVYLDFMNADSLVSNTEMPFRLLINPGSSPGPVTLRIEIETHGGYSFHRTFTRFELK